MAADDDEIHPGFMGGVLGRAKKVLFPDVDVDSTEATTSSSVKNNNESRRGKRDKARSRRARLAAASSSSLANIAPNSAESVESHSSKVHSAGVGKENKVPKPKPLIKRGNTSRMDSLVATFSNQSMDRVEGSETVTHQPRKLSLKNIADQRRKSRCSVTSNDCSLSVCSEQQINGNATRKQPQQSMKVKADPAQWHQKEKKDPVNELDREERLSSLSQYSMADIDNSFNGCEMKQRKNRRKGRCKHPVSSLVQGECPKVLSKRNSGLPSLMTLTSSTQKVQKSISITQKKPVMKDMKPMQPEKYDRGQSQNQESSSTSATAGQESVESGPKNDCALTDEKRKDAELVSHVQMLKIGDDQMECSTPLTIRHRSRPGDITSPPGFLNRLSTMTNPSFSLFPERSPMPDSNPNLKKRFDKKKTPDKLIAFGTIKSMVGSPPPSATKMSISPHPYARIGEHESEIGRRDYTGLDYISYDGASPRVLIASSSYVSSKTDGGNGLSDTRSKLFSSVDSGEQGVDTGGMNNSNRHTDVTADSAGESQPDHELKKKGADSKAVRVRGSAVMDLEVAAPLPRKLSESTSLVPLSTGADTDSEEEEISTDDAAGTADCEEDGKALEPRRSSRESKPTDRLTVASWKKKKGKKSNRKVRFDKLAATNEDIEPSQALEASVGEEDESENDSEGESEEELRTNSGRSSNKAATHHEDESESETRRSLRQSKPTNRLTVATWKKKKGNLSYGTVQFDQAAYAAEEGIDLASEPGGIRKGVEPITATQVVSEKSPKQNEQSLTLINNEDQQKSSSTESPGDCGWSSEEVRALRRAQKEINPTSTLYWQEVAIHVKSKSSSECHNKWQSMIATPQVQRTMKKKDASQFDASISDDDDDDDEDDFLNSSPYHEVGKNSGMFNNFGKSTRGLSPCVKPLANSTTPQERRKGYNTYIENLRKQVNRIEKKKKAQKPSKTTLSDPIKKIHADLGIGESQMSGNLLPDGTLQIQEESSEDELDDIWED